MTTLTSTYKYTRTSDKGTNTTFVGYLVSGTLDGGDYGVSETIDLEQPDGEVITSVPVSKLVKIEREEFCDYVELQYGLEMTR